MLKEKVLFYTDCSIFGGCERPFFDIFTSADFASRYDFALIYRKSNKYSQFLLSSYPDLCLQKVTGIFLPDINTCKDYLERKISNASLCRVVKLIASATFRVFYPLIFIYELIYLYFLFRKQKIYIMHINNGGYPGSASCRVAVIAAKLAGIKRIILSVHNTALRKKGIFDRVIDFFVRKNISILVTGSKSSGAALKNYRGFDAKKIINIYHGIKPLVVNKADNSRLSGLGGDYILMVASFEERKGHKYVISAFRQLILEHPEYDDIKLVLIGDGPMLEDIKSLVSQNNLKSKVFFLGHREDYINFVVSCVFLLNPSIESEDLPYIILEAMSIGIPVIGTDVCGIPEEIENEVSGIVIPPKNSEALIQAMHSLLSDKNKLIQMGIESKKRFLDFFTFDKMIKNYIVLYEQLLNDNSIKAA